MRYASSLLLLVKSESESIQKCHCGKVHIMQMRTKHGMLFSYILKLDTFNFKYRVFFTKV